MSFKTYTLFFLFVISFTHIIQAQSVGIGTTTPNASAALEVKSSSQGVLFPRLTTAQRKAIINPTVGLMVFDVEKNVFYYYSGFQWMALGAIQEKSIKPIEITSNYNSLNQFGFSAAMNASYAAIGVPEYDTLTSSNIGAVLIFRKLNGIWALHQRILAPDSASADQFGYSLDMSGDYMVVGTPYKKILTTTNCGKAYVYKLNLISGFYEIDAQLNNPAGLIDNTFFGWSVAVTHTSNITGKIAVAIGAPAEYNPSGSLRGTVSVFGRLAANSYVNLNTITGLSASEFFGLSIDLDSNLLVIGAPYYDTTITTVKYAKCGRIQINSSNGSNYSTVDGRIIPNVDTNNIFGYQVKIDSNFIALGSDAVNNNNAAGIYFYFRSAPNSFFALSNFLNHRVDFESGVSTKPMGYSFAFSDKFFIVGVTHKTNYPFGSTYAINSTDYGLLYQRNATVLSFYNQLKPIDESAKNTRFGYSVAAFGNNYMLTMPESINADGTRGAIVFGTFE
ncbi:MAG: FG-GAP repeat protein [Ferruginibacter sp.]